VFDKIYTLLISLLCAASAFGQTNTNLLQGYVDTRVGTAASITKTAGMFGKGTEEYAHTLPAVLSPFGMNFWTPQTQWTEKKGVCPYLYKDMYIQGFRCSHWIVGGCTQDYGSFTITPSNTRRHTPEGSRFTHKDEIATPSYYSVILRDCGVKAEMTATQRAGIMRFTFENPDSAFIFFTVNSDEGEGSIEVQDGSIIAINPAHRIYQGWGERTGHAGNLVAECNVSVMESGRVDKNTIWVRLRPSKTVIVKAANSFINPICSRRNLEGEIPDWDFDHVRKQLEDVWEKKLSQIMVYGGSDDEKAKLYGSIYRASFLPHDISDIDGRAPKFASCETVEADTLCMEKNSRTANAKWYMVHGKSNSMVNGTCYDDFSMWDTYRAQHPLLTIIEPKRSGEMMQSLVKKYTYGGWMPIFPCWNSYTSAMIGDHCASVIADAYIKGVRNFDAEKAYEGLRKNAFESPATYEEYKNGMGRRALKSYLKYGYIPLEDSVKEAFHQHEQVSRTLEYAYDDYALAVLARTLGKKADAKVLMKRSRNYANVFDKRTGWVNGRHEDGSFVEAHDVQYVKEPEKHPEAHELTPVTFSTFITEGVPAHYSWYVPHDAEGLIRCMGGRDSFEAKLDSMFGFAGNRQIYWHGNEPCHQIAYMYDFIGRQDKCAKAVNHIMQSEYLNAPGGLSGNDDAGQMSAWYIFSALGFYPVCPGDTRYYLGYPTFTRADIKVGRDKLFTVIAHGEYRDGSISVRLNGKRLKRAFITHKDIMRGGVLEFEIE